MKKFAFPVLALIASAAVAAAETPSDRRNAPKDNGSSQQQEEQAEEKGERKICRRIDTTGSRLGSQRVCMTEREWRAHSFDGR